MALLVALLVAVVLLGAVIMAKQLSASLHTPLLVEEGTEKEAPASPIAALPAEHFLQASWREGITRHFKISEEDITSISFVKEALTEEEQHTGCALAVSNADGTGSVDASIVGLYHEDDHSLVIKSPDTIYCPESAFFMFNRLYSLTALDFSNFNTSNVMNMDYMFSGCHALTSLDVSGFDTGKVTSMCGMFTGCNSLTSLDVSGFDTSKVTDMSYIFYNCSSLTSLDVSGFDTGKVTDMYEVFYDCSSLTKINLPYGIQANVSAQLPGIWFDQATGEEVTIIDSTYCSRSAAETMTITKTFPFHKFDYLTSAWKEKLAEHYGISMDSIERISFVKGTLTEKEKNTGYPLAVTNINGAGNLGNAIVGLYNASNHSLVIKSADIIYCPESAYDMFYGLNSLTALDFSNFDTSRVTDMSYMFYKCSSLRSLDVSGFDTGKVTNTSLMFCSCTSLTSLNISGFDTGNVTDMDWMFSGCEFLTSLDVSGFDTSKVTSMALMFDDCKSLTSLDVSGFDTSEVTDMNSMFFNCVKLESLDVSGFDTGNVTDMYGMIEYCESLTNLDVSGFDTGKVTDMGHMFGDCKSLTSLDVSGFDTSEVTDMNSMFFNCVKLESLDVSGFDTGKVTDMGHMFGECSSLTSVSLPDSLTKLDDDAFEDSYNVVLICSPGSYAAQYAQEHGIKHQSPGE